jgi:excisionase family DNA binding protein
MRRGLFFYGVSTGESELESQLERLAYTKNEAALTLGLSLRTIDNLIATKELTARRIGRRVLIPASALRALLRCDHETMLKVE